MAIRSRPPSLQLRVVGVAFWRSPAAGAVGLVSVGVGATAYVLSGGGAQPDEVIPASALGYFSIDLDPSAAQKIEAVRILSKFPELKQQMKLGEKDDLREFFFKEVQKDGTCSSVDFKKQVAPWLGNRLGVAGMPAATEGGTPTFLVALQVTDQKKAEKGVGVLEACGAEGEKPGHAFVGDYLLFAETAEQATSFAADARAHPLSKDAKYASWMGKVGDRGIINGYLSSKAPRALMGAAFDQAEKSDDAGEAVPFNDLKDQMLAAYDKFEGGAMTVRIHDGAFVTESAAKLSGTKTGAAGTSIGELPATTGAAVSVSLTPGWSNGLLDSMKQTLGSRAGVDPDQLITEFEGQTGLSFPADLETLLGQGLTLSVDSGADVVRFAGSQQPEDLPVALRVIGDPSRVGAVYDKLAASLPPDFGIVKQTQSTGAVVFGPNAAYNGEVAKAGTLGHDPTFTSVVPNAAKASVVAFVNFNAGDGWIAQLVDAAGGADPEVAENLAPLKALGMSTGVDPDGTTRALVRLSTD